MNFIKSLTLALVISASLAVSLGLASAQTGGSSNGSSIPGGLVPGNDTVGPVGDVDAQYKFDDGLYQKIQDLILEEPQDGDFGVYDGERYYSIIMVVSRDDGDVRDPDQTARENKDSIVEYLNQLGARDVLPAESLSFVTASIPVADIPGLSLRDEIYKMGDGELPVTPAVDTARHTIHATPSNLSSAIGWVPDGTGVVVAVIDTGIYNEHLNSKVAEQVYCSIKCGKQDRMLIIGRDKAHPHTPSVTFASHGTQVAQVLAASDMPAHNGIAPGVTLLDAMYVSGPGTRNSLDSLAHALDWSYSRGADVANISANFGYCGHDHTTSYNLIANEAVDKGIVIVKSAGNEGLSESTQRPRYHSINNPGCAHNVITVGGIDDRVAGTLEMYEESGRGPTSISEPRLVPHIVAPAYKIQTLDYPDNATTSPRNGTSYAVPQVSGTAAMMLQIEPKLTPVEVKAALLLGADWQGPVPCKSSTYERNIRHYNNCSYKMQPVNPDTANDAASLGILNNAGFGILDAAESLRYVSSNAPHVISNHLDPDITSRQYQFTVTDITNPVKVILTWLVHPHGGIIEQASGTVAAPVADLNLEVRPPSGTSMYAGSSHQTTEFIVFKPTRIGTYTVTVTGSGLTSINESFQIFTLASTAPFTGVSDPPQAPDIDIEAVPSSLTSVRPDIGAGNTITAATGADKGIITTGFLAEGTISYTADAGESGIDRVTYMVSDGAGSTAQGIVYFYINEQGNDRPVLGVVPGMQTQIGDAATFTASASDGNRDPITYAIRNAPAGAAMGSGTGAFSWTPDASDVGDHIFDIVAYDDAGGLDVQKMAITVRDPDNGSPTAPVVHRSTTSGTSILVTPDIRDPEGQPTSMILAVGATKGTVREGFLAANIIAYVPRQEGTDIIWYTASDGAGGATTSTVYIHTGTSDDPDLDVIGVKRAVASRTLSFQASAADPDSSRISYVMDGAPDGATLDESTGNFRWTPATTDVGDHTFTITAYDGQGGFDTEPVAIVVSAPGTTNRNPNIVDFDSAARQNSPKSIAPQTSDPDDDQTSIILATGATKGTTLHDSLRFGIITYVPDTGQTGTDELIYVVSDGRGGASTGIIYVHIEDPDNDEPTMNSIGNKQVRVPDTLTFDVGASDGDRDPLTYAVRNAPAGAMINSATGAFGWTPAASDAGDHTFTVTVHDDAGGFATEDIIVTVTDPTSTNRNPTAPDDSATTAGSRVSILPVIDDPDGDDISIIAATGAIQGLVDAELLADAIIAYTPFEGATGVDTITYTVSDGRGGIAMGTITITITGPS